MPRNFRELEAGMSPEARARAETKAKKMLAEMPLDELREARAMTQVHLAKILGVNQAAVSKLERRADMYVSTLQDFVKAMGGELKIIARFPEGIVEINQFAQVQEARDGGAVAKKSLEPLDTLTTAANLATPRRRA
jgi:DNA-binding XRE family transcriptional regulator